MDSTEPKVDKSSLDSTNIQNLLAILNIQSKMDDYFKQINPSFMTDIMKNLSNPEIVKVSKGFIEAAKLDLKAAYLLRHNAPPIYSLAIYHLQQAVEKMAKALFYLSIGTPPSFTHESQKTVIDIVNEIKNRMNANTLLVNGSLSKYQKFSGAYQDYSEKRKSELLNATSDEIVGYLDAFSDTFAPLENVDISKLIEIIKTNEDLFRKIPGINPIVLNNLDKIISNPDAIKKKQFSASGTLRLIILAPILSYHEAYTRYPLIKKRQDEEGLNASDYNDNLGVVRAFDRLYLEVELLVNDFFMSKS